MGHSAHVTNVRFTNDKRHVISVGGADNAIFQWQFIPAEGGGEGGHVQEDGHIQEVGGDSDSEASDSDLSDVDSLDSDLEKEQEKSYERSAFSVVMVDTYVVVLTFLCVWVAFCGLLSVV